MPPAPCYHLLVLALTIKPEEMNSKVDILFWEKFSIDNKFLVKLGTARTSFELNPNIQEILSTLL